MGVHLGSHMVALVLGLSRLMGGIAYIGTPLGLKYAPDPPWWGVVGGPWTIGTTTGLCYLLPSSYRPLSTTQYTPPL